jgi:hypothetical protein
MGPEQRCGRCAHYREERSTQDWSRKGFGPVYGRCTHPSILALPFFIARSCQVYPVADGSSCGAFEPNETGENDGA